MQTVRRVLQFWPISAAKSHGATPIATGAHFSGAQIWRVTTSTEQHCLRAWPTHVRDDERLRAIHGLQAHLATVGPRITPVPIANPSGETLVLHEGRFWELTTWRPGVAEASDEPSPTKLEAACEALARVHVAMAAAPIMLDGTKTVVGRSPAMLARIDLAERMMSGELERLLAAANRIAEVELREPLVQGLRLAATRIPTVYKSLLDWKDKALTLQWRLCDVRQEHVLFTGDAVTGLVDFGAADVDLPAGDLARLLGDMAADRPDRWHRGVAAYERARPLSRDERAAIEVFDASGLCLSLSRWAKWAGARGEWPEGVNVEAAAGRIERLTRRLEKLK